MLLEELMKIAEKFPDDLAVLSDNERVTYSELMELSKKAAHKLSRMDVGKGDFVTIELPRSRYYVAATMGTWMVGAAFAALDSTYPADRLEYIANDCHAKVRITDAFFEDIDDEPSIQDICFPEGNDRSLLVYTSGSTGRPKGVLHSHLSIMDSVVRGNVAIDGENFKRKGEILGLPVPLSFIAGLTVLFGGMIGAMPVYIVPYVALRDPAKMSRLIAENDISTSYIPPKMIKVIDNTSGALKQIITGSEKLSNTWRSDVSLINFYGSSETAGGITFFPVDKEYENTPIGRPAGKEAFYILDENGNEANEGELCIAGHLALGYYGLPEQTAAAFIDDPFKDRDGFDILYKTGDLVKKNENGDLVYVNRKDWMIKINGQRVEPGEIEHIIRMTENVADAAVTSFVGAAGQTYIAAYYTVKKDSEVKEEDIKKIIGENLPIYMMPAYFVRLDTMPLNANGKLDRKSLKAPEIAASAEYIAPRDDIERELCTAFEKALDLPRIGIKDDFFSLGGDSIRVMILEQLCPDLALSTKMIYEKHTVEELAEA
ncbi:MAG: non-ribosomal peptide synthetase, partial [Oscillospiraceae bacterium]|nr:non-ribosomal peptide synthetase [Oscillospiraceae bacterium]